MTRRHLALAAALSTFLPAAAAHAGEPVLPLSEVTRGMQCTVRSVVQGTTISTFDAVVQDVVQGDPGAGQPYLLIRVSGPAVDRTGIGPGFSGSPVSCPRPDGTLAIAGAISEGIGDYGNTTVLATPIELILGTPVDAPAETRTDPALLRAARPLATPLSVGGLSPAVASLVSRAAAKVKRVVYATPAAPRAAAFPVQTLQPGSAMAVGYAAGDFTAGSIGTVAYTDADRVWAFGHPLDSAGRRTLFLQDAYVYDVINNPLGSQDLTTYKYAAPGHVLGTLTNDAVSAVTGRVGAPPPSFPLKLVATDLDTKKVRTANVSVADETAIGLPNGVSALGQVAPLALAQMAYETLDGLPLRQSGSMCVRITVKERPKPLRFCNTYVGGVGAAADSGGGPLIDDLGSAIGILDAFNFGPLHTTGVEVNVKLRRSLRLAYLQKVLDAPTVLRRGRTYTVKVRIQRQNGPASTRSIRVHVPKGMPVGPRELTLTGPGPDVTPASAADALSSVLDLGDLTGDGSDGGDPAGPRTVNGVAARIAALHREDGVTASFRPPGSKPADDTSDAPKPRGAERVAQKERAVLRDPELRIAGAVAKTVFVAP